MKYSSLHSIIRDMKFGNENPVLAKKAFNAFYFELQKDIGSAINRVCKKSPITDNEDTKAEIIHDVILAFVQRTVMKFDENRYTSEKALRAGLVCWIKTSANNMRKDRCKKMINEKMQNEKIVEHQLYEQEIEVHNNVWSETNGDLQSDESESLKNFTKKEWEILELHYEYYPKQIKRDKIKLFAKNYNMKSSSVGKFRRRTLEKLKIMNNPKRVAI